MLILIFIVSLILLIVGGFLEDENGSLGGAVLSLISGGIAFISVIALFIMLICFPYNVDKKIPMYEEENQKIEIKIKETVRAYMNFEKETYTDLIENAHLETLLIKYPELNSNELIKSEIETYKENSKQIKQLKEGQINKSLMAWWLYFGK